MTTFKVKTATIQSTAAPATTLFRVMRVTTSCSAEMVSILYQVPQAWISWMVASVPMS